MTALFLALIYWSFTTHKPHEIPDFVKLVQL